MSDDAAKKQVQGKCEEISEKNGWTTFNIDVGRQYPARLSTKLEAVVKAGRDAGNQVAVWTFSESQGGENPNKPGTHYINRRLEKVEVGAALDPALGGSPAAGAAGGSTAGGTGGRSADERTSIERQSLVKAAIAVFPTGSIENADEWFSLLDQLDDWMGRHRGGAAPASASAPAPAATPSSSSSEFPAAGPDDDIPF